MKLPGELKTKHVLRALRGADLQVTKGHSHYHVMLAGKGMSYGFRMNLSDPYMYSKGLLRKMGRTLGPNVKQRVYNLLLEQYS
jgi:hypothetical protein